MTIKQTVRGTTKREDNKNERKWQECKLTESGIPQDHDNEGLTALQGYQMSEGLILEIVTAMNH